MGMSQAHLSNVQAVAGVPRLRQSSLNGTVIPFERCQEWAAIQRAIAGDRNAQEHLFGRDTGRLYRAAFAVLHNREDVEDAVQDSLCQAYISLGTFQGRSSFATWLTRIAVNSALVTRREKSAHPEASLDEILGNLPGRLPQGAVDARPDPEKLYATREINALLEEHVRQLPPTLQAAFRLRVRHRLSGAEASRELGISLGAFKSRIFRARRMLESGLQQSLGVNVSALPPGRRGRRAGNA